MTPMIGVIMFAGVFGQECGSDKICSSFYTCFNFNETIEICRQDKLTINDMFSLNKTCLLLNAICYILITINEFPILIFKYIS